MEKTLHFTHWNCRDAPWYIGQGVYLCWDSGNTLLFCQQMEEEEEKKQDLVPFLALSFPSFFIKKPLVLRMGRITISKRQVKLKKRE